MIVIATVCEYDYKATVVYIRHMNIITSVWLLLPCLWPFNLPHTAVCRVLATGFLKSNHMSNGIAIAHVIAFGKTELQELCKPQYS